MAKKAQKKDLKRLYDEMRSAQEAADWLNKNGYVSPRGKKWESHSVGYAWRSNGWVKQAPAKKPKTTASHPMALIEDIITSNLSEHTKVRLLKLVTA